MSRGTRPGCRVPGGVSGWTLGCQLSPALPSGPLPPPPTGQVHQWKDPDPRLFDNQYGTGPTPVDPSAAFRLSQSDVYKELRLRGYNYGPHFQGILEANLEGGCKGAPCFGANSCCPALDAQAG